MRPPQAKLDALSRNRFHVSQDSKTPQTLMYIFYTLVFVNIKSRIYWYRFVGFFFLAITTTSNCILAHNQRRFELFCWETEQACVKYNPRRHRLAALCFWDCAKDSLCALPSGRLWCMAEWNVGFTSDQAKLINHIGTCQSTFSLLSKLIAQGNTWWTTSELGRLELENDSGVQKSTIRNANAGFLCVSKIKLAVVGAV